MYSVKVHETGELKSIHMGNDIGLKAAVEEALLRTHLTGKDHDVLDDYGHPVFTLKPRCRQLWQCVTRYLRGTQA